MAWLLAALLALPAASQAAERAVTVTVLHAREAFTHTLALREAQQATFTGQVRGTLGKPGSMILNALLGGGGALQLQLELTRPGAEPTTFQLQSEVELAPGAPVNAAECDGWTVTLKYAGPRTSARPSNRRVSADLRRGTARVLCRQLLKPGTQANVVSGGTKGGKRFGYILNTLLAAEGAGYSLQYQLEHSPPGAQPLQLQNQATVAPGRPHRESNAGYRLELRVD